MPDRMLNVTNHDRNSAELRYVYPVVSRRSGSVSVGINLNANNACNWRCLYCQVPNLTRGSSPSIALDILESELRDFLNELLHGDFMKDRVPERSQRINDIALSGNGEPTSSTEFSDVISIIKRVRDEVIKGVRRMKGRPKAKETAQNIMELLKEGTEFSEAIKTTTAEMKISEQGNLNIQLKLTGVYLREY